MWVFLTQTGTRVDNYWMNESFSIFFLNITINVVKD